LLAFSCNKDKEVPDAEQSEIDNKIIVEYLSSHKLDTLASNPITNINWKIVPTVDSDTISLADIALKDTVTSGGVVYYMYYIEVEEGANIEGDESTELMIVDYNEFLLDNRLLSSSEDDTDAVSLEINTRINGIKLGLKHFFTGILPTDDLGNNYRENTSVPGRGILIFPSGLGYKDIGNDEIAPNQPLRVDLVLYTKRNFPEEEK
jgi:hypothetical protein